MPSPDDQTSYPQPAERTAAAPDPYTRVDSRGFATEVQPVYPHAAPGLPSVAGYTITREVGRGGMGIVYAAYDPAFDREVAVKVMHPGQNAGRFVIEAKVTARLPHPGIPPVYNLGALADGRPYLAMKLIRGKTLAAELKEADLPELLAAFERICETVGFAHSRGIVHRDLKPQNVMVGAFGEVLVMDWGLARFVQLATNKGQGWDTPGAVAVRAEAVETIAGEVKGTPAYMAPEQARGDDIDARADVFALGGILAMILTGKPPFVGTNTLDTVMKAARAELRDCFGRLDACEEDPALVEIAKRALAPFAYERFAYGAEVAAAVAAYRADVQERLQHAERERAVSAAEAREQRKRRKVQLALLGAVTLLVCGASAFALWESDRRAERTRKAEQEKIQEASRKELAERSARHAIELATTLRRQLRFEEAEQALKQGRVAVEQDGPEVAQLDQALADTRFARDLDEIRYQKWEWIPGLDSTGEFNEKVVPDLYEKAFAARGLRLRTADPAAAARTVATSPIKRELVSAIDDWALFEPDPQAVDRLLEVTRRADPHPWSNAFRDRTVWRDRAALLKLAETAKAEGTAPATITALAEVMKRVGLSPADLLTAARAAHPDDFGLAYSLGVWYTANGETARAPGPYEAACAIRPKNSSARNALGAAYMSFGDYPAAVALFRENARRDPTDATAYANLGGVLYYQRKYPEAIEAFRRAVKLSRTPADTLSNLGTALAESGQYVEAIETNRRAVELDPRSCRIRTNLAVAYRLSGDYQSALAAYREAVELDPTNAFTRNSFGVLWKTLGKYDAAVQEYKAALRLAPNHANALRNLGAAYLVLGDPASASPVLLEAVRLNPNSPETYAHLGNALVQVGDLDGAVRALSSAVRLEPTAANYSDLGNALHKQKNYPAAITAFQEALRGAPNFTIALFNLGNVLRDAGDPAGALALYRKVLALDSNFAHAHNSIGAVLEAGGDTAGALVSFQNAVRADARNVEAHSNLATIYFRQEDYAAAARSAEAVVALAPKFAQGHAVLGMARLKLGDVAGAREALTDAARLDKRWLTQLAFLPAAPPAPPPRPIDR